MVQQKNDKEAADAVTKLIDALPGADSLQLSDKAKVEEARAAYTDLTDAQKALVAPEKLEKLKGLEAKLVLLQKEQDDKNAADTVTALIDALPGADSLQLSDKAKVEEARAAYADLTDAQKALIASEKLEKLTALENEIRKLLTERGDVNGDGNIDSLDALIALRYSVGLEDLDEEHFLKVDVTKDGVVDSIDALDILRYSVGLIDCFD